MIYLCAQTHAGQRSEPGPRTARYMARMGIAQTHIINGQKVKNPASASVWLRNPKNGCPTDTSFPIYYNLEDRSILIDDPAMYLSTLTQIRTLRPNAPLWAQILALHVNNGKMDYLTPAYAESAAMFAYHNSQADFEHRKKREAIARLRTRGFRIAIGLWCRDQANNDRRLWPKHMRREIRFAVEHADDVFVWTKNAQEDDRHNKRLLQAVYEEVAV